MIIMKKTTTILLLLIASVLFTRSYGQRSPAYGEITSDQFSLNNLSARVSNLSLIDSFNVNGDSPEGYDLTHFASFDIELGSQDAANIVKVLYAGIGGNQLPEAVLRKMNSRQEAIQEQAFNMATVKEIVFPELNAESRDSPKARITLQASNVSYRNGDGKAMFDRSRGRMAGNRFKLTMAGLPTNGVLRISSLRFVPSSKDPFLYFSVDVPSADIQQWYDWLNSRKNGSQYKAGYITLQDESLKQVLSIELAQLEIVSVATVSTSGNIARSKIGLLTRQPIIIN
jgi:hypothetical protein